jgi:hypothetical protein
MRHIKKFKVFETKKPPIKTLTERQQNFLDKHIKSSVYSNGIRPTYYTNLDGNQPVVNVHGSFKLSGNFSSTIKPKTINGIKFGVIRGDFGLWNTGISSTEGFPTEIWGTLELSLCLQLGSLKGLNLKELGSLVINHSNIGRLEGLPETMTGNWFSIKSTRIVTLEGCPKNMNDQTLVKIGNNERLISLEGLPKNIKVKNIDVQQDPHLGPFDIKGEYLIEGFKEFQKTGTWIPYYTKLYFDSKEFKYTTEVVKGIINEKSSKEVLQKYIDENPEESVVVFRGLWNQILEDPKYSGLRKPKDYEEEIGDFDDLTTLGF